MKCTFEDDNHGAHTSRFRLPFVESGSYQFICEKGHKNFVVLQAQKFEILFQIVACAIVDGYFREAVSSFTSALERFYEFAITVICLKNGLGDNELTSCWKEVKNQSERQLGAFIYLWCSEFKTKPTTLPSKLAGFRNQVIHKGAIPTRCQAIDFGKEVREIIAGSILLLEENAEKEIRQCVRRQLRDSSKGAPSGTNPTTMAYPTILSLTVSDEDFHSKSLEGKRCPEGGFRTLRAA